MRRRTLEITTRTSTTSSASAEDVYDVISDLGAHLVWSGERASDQTFKLLSLRAQRGPASVGTTFTSTGANFNGTFHDSSVVTGATRPSVFVIETDARLERRRGKTWEVRFTHRYDIEALDDGSRIVYTETIHGANYVPYWLKPWARPVFTPLVNRADKKQLDNLAKLAEERSSSP